MFLFISLEIRTWIAAGYFGLVSLFNGILTFVG